MNETRNGLGFGLFALVPLACCVGLPLIVAGGVSVAVVAWAGGITLAALALIGAVSLVVVRAHRRRNHRRPTPVPGAHS